VEIHTVGTSSAVPTAERGLPANLVKFDGDHILFDCGEGTQLELMEEKLGIMKLDRVFISHWHADHFSGLLGLIQTLEMEGRERPLYIHGPPRTEEFTERILDTGYFSRSYDIYVEHMTAGEVLEQEEYTVEAIGVDHSVTAFGYALRERPQRKANKDKMQELGLESSPKIGRLMDGETIDWDGDRIDPDQVVEEVPGRKFVYTGDTAKCRSVVRAAEDADLLLHEATVTEEEVGDRYGHSSARQAAEVASEAGAERLVLTHISRRYRNDPEELEEEAQEVFDNAQVADDGQRFKVSPHRPED
jgi:ribonuclease Z